MTVTVMWLKKDVVGSLFICVKAGWIIEDITIEAGNGCALKILLLSICFAVTAVKMIHMDR